ncbi:MAG: BLUF domain-containing protein, partial [Phenylobacterium sp.]
VREFGLWSMCARQLSPIDAQILGELDRRPNFEPADFPERVVMRLLRAVASVHRQLLTDQQTVLAA